MESAAKEETMICAACDLIIDPAVKMESAWKDLAPGPSLSSPEKINDEEGIEKYIPKPDAWITFCKYMLDGKNHRVKMFRSRHYHELTFCPFCTRLIKKIHAFEKEITQLYERIDSMINCLRSKIQVSLDSSPSSEKSVVREFLLGIKSTNKPKFKKKVEKPVIKDVRIVLTRVEGNDNSQKLKQEDAAVAETEESVDVDLEPEVEKVEIQNEAADVAEAADPENNENQDTTANLRKSCRKRKSKNTNKEFLYFDEKNLPVKEEVETPNNLTEEWSDGSQNGYETYPEMDISFEQENSLDLEGSEEEQYNTNEDSGPESKPKYTRKQKDESGTESGHNKRDSRERKTRRRRLVINQLEEPNLFEWKGFKFRKLDNGKMQCEHCPSLLNNQPCLILHIRKIHLREGVGVFPCNVCGKSFDRAEILKAHVFIHDEKRYQCYICGKLYHQRPNLTHHIKTHAGNFKYQCDFENCRKTFLTRGQLANHTRRHLGVKTFQCEYCSRLFIDRSELNRHLRSHAEQLPFKCTLCNSSFFIKYRLKRHYMNVHKVEPPEIIETVDALKLPANEPAPVEVQIVINREPSSITMLQQPSNIDGTVVLTAESVSSNIVDATEISVTEADTTPTNTIHIVDAVFMEETVVTTEPPELHQVNPHKELITFQSMLE